MFSNDITLAGDSSSTRTYALRSIVDGNSVRAAATAPVGEDESLAIKHSLVVQKTGIPADRHLVRLDLAKLNSEEKLAGAALYVVIEIPRDSVITAAIIKDMRTQLVNFLTNTNVDKLINREP
jgi:hypothetical protein